MDALACINQVLARPQREDLARTLLKIYQAWGCEVAFLNDLCDIEIAKTGASTLNLLILN